MKVKEIASLSTPELSKRVEDVREELFRLRLRLATRQLENYRKIRIIKRTIARMKTVLRQREMAGER
ncbi:MAG: 50S ribosomal protein L29 [Chloroflexi bacterium]|nr:50S ribosomal protein L29 [Chloroflexota bacterium]